MSGSLQVLFAVPWAYPDSTGGRATYLDGLARALAAHGVSVTVVSGRRNGGSSETVSGLLRHVWYQMPTSNIAQEQRAHMRGLAACLRELEERGASFDVVVYSDPVCVPPAAPRKAFHTAKRVYSFHSPARREVALGLESLRGVPVTSLLDRIRPLLYRCYGVWAHRAEDSGLRTADLTICLSAYMRAELQAAHPCVTTSVAVIPGGVDLERFRPLNERTAERAKRGVREGEKLLVTARRLEARMGLDRLLSAMTQVIQSQRVQLLIAGDGQERARLSSMIAELGLSQSVRLLGKVPADDLPALYACADLFVLPTRSLEGFGLATLEALACGTPVAATPAGATGEWLACLDLRMVSQDTSSQSIADTVIRMLTICEAEGEHLRTKCREFAERYRWEEIARQVERELRSLLIQNARASQPSGI